MGTLAVHWGWLDTVPGFPDRLRENPPRQGFFEHPEYLAVRAHLPAPWQDILDLAYYSGWRKHEILGLTWDELDEAGGVIRLSPARSKTLVGRILPISHPIAEALARRRARRNPDSPLVFHRDGIPIRRWCTAWRTACQAAGVLTRSFTIASAPPPGCRRRARQAVVLEGIGAAFEQAGRVLAQRRVGIRPRPAEAQRVRQASGPREHADSSRRGRRTRPQRPDDRRGWRGCASGTGAAWPGRLAAPPPPAAAVFFDDVIVPMQRTFHR